MVEYIIDHGTLAIAKYLKILCAYAVLNEKEKCKESLLYFSKEVMLPEDSLLNVLDYPKEKLYEYICDTARKVDYFDPMFNIIFAIKEPDIKDLVFTQKVPINSNI